MASETSVPIPDSEPVTAPDDDETTDPTGNDGSVQSPSMGPEEAVACAAVEFGYIRLGRGDVGDEIDAELVRGAEAAIALGVESYEKAGRALLAAVGTLDAASAADTLLGLCAERGFERLS